MPSVVKPSATTASLSYFKFTVVRNPWARALSFFSASLGPGAPDSDLGPKFLSFLKQNAGRGHFRPQVFWLKPLAGQRPLDYVCRCETIEDDFAHVAAQIGLKANSLPHMLNRSSGRLFRLYTKESRDLVERVFAEDIATLGYTFPE